MSEKRRKISWTLRTLDFPSVDIHATLYLPCKISHYRPREHLNFPNGIYYLGYSPIDTSGQLDFPKSRRVRMMGTNSFSIAIGSDVVQRALLAALAITASAFAIKLKEKLIDLILHRTRVVYEASALLLVSFYCSRVVQDLIPLGKVFLQSESFYLHDSSIYRFVSQFPRVHMCATAHCERWATPAEGGICRTCTSTVCSACFIAEADPPICTTCAPKEP